MLTKTSVTFDYQFDAEDIGTCIYGSVTGSYELADKGDHITPGLGAMFTVNDVRVTRIETEAGDYDRPNMHRWVVDAMERFLSAHVANLDNEKLVELAEGEL